MVSVLESEMRGKNSQDFKKMLYFKGTVAQLRGLGGKDQLKLGELGIKADLHVNRLYQAVNKY